MDAKNIVRRLIENDEDPKDFIDRNDDIYPVSERPTHEYRINIGDGGYRAGFIFTVSATTRREAIHLANKFVQAMLQHSDGGIDLEVPGNLEGAGARVSKLRVYLDDDCVVTDEDIVDESPLGWAHVDPGAPE